MNIIIRHVHVASFFYVERVDYSESLQAIKQKYNFDIH